MFDLKKTGIEVAVEDPKQLSDTKKKVKSKFRNPTVSTLAKNEVEKIFSLDPEFLSERLSILF